MKASHNHVTLVGNLTRDLDLKYIPSGKAVAEVSIAINEFRGGEEHTSFFDVTLWGKDAENTAKYCGKGSCVLIDGRLDQQRWEKDGQKRSKVCIIAHRVVFLDTRQGTPQAEEAPSAPPEPASEPENSRDDGEESELPF